jgi:ribosomal protein L32
LRGQQSKQQTGQRKTDKKLKAFHLAKPLSSNLNIV